MDLIDLLGEAAYYLFRALVIGAPLLLWEWTVQFSRVVRGGSGSGDATVIAGVMLGLAALPLLIPPMALTWDAVVTPEGVWDLTLLEFLERALRYAARAGGELTGALVLDDERANLLAWCGLAMLVWTLRIGATLTQRRGRRARALLMAELIVLVTSFYGIVYVGTLALWSINQLNFWVLLVVILLLQDFRHNEPPLMPRVISMLSGRNRHRELPPEPVRVVD
jgi:hypothetical protein